MGEAGRKLTIRMPDNPRLKSAEVGQIHLDPGASVRVGSPIMTLVARRREHMVRAPRSGRVVPLVANGDDVQSGDPLYVLNIDEQALAQSKRESRELVAIEKAKWSAGITPDVIEPMMRQRDAKADSKMNRTVLGSWAKPALAVALYILACFALLPILNAFGRDASTEVLIGMCVGSLLFAAVIYHLYAPDSGIWPRWTVRMVALSWIGISAMAIFYRPDNVDDITLADAATEAAAPIASLFNAGETTPDATPVVVEAPVLALASGVTAGPGEAVPVPTWSVPLSVLGAPGQAPVPHGVTVLDWSRVNPTNDAGAPLPVPEGDAAPGLGTAEAALAAETRADPAPPDPNGAIVLGSSEVPDLTVLMADALADAKVEAEAAALAASLDAAAPILRTPAADGDASGLTLAGLAPASLAEAQPLTDAGSGPDQAGSALAALAQTAAASTWLGKGVIPVLQGSVGDAAGASADTGLADAPTDGLAVLAALATPRQPKAGSTPELLLVAQLNSTEDVWMTDQVVLSKTDDGPAVAVPDAKTAQAQVQRAVGPLTAPSAPGTAAISSNAAPGGPVALAVLNGAPDLPAASAAEAIQIAAIAVPPPVARVIPALTGTGPLPGAAPVAPPWEAAPAPSLAERLLVFLFYDDPRLTDLPQVGDDWVAQVSPDLAAGIASSKVEAVGEIVEVTNWCAAANDPGGQKEKFLPGGAYRTASLSDRIRLLQVRVAVDPGKLALLEQELPVFGAAPVDFMGPRVPLLGGAPTDKVLERVAAYLGQTSGRDSDPNTPPKIAGGKYFASADALATTLRAHGCEAAIWNQGDGPVNKIGSALAQKLGG